MHKILLFFLGIVVAAQAHSQQFRLVVHFDSTANTPATGRLYVFSGTDTTRPVQEADPFNPAPAYVLDVKNWKPGETKIVDASTPGYPVTLSAITPGYYKFRAVLDVDTNERSNTEIPGNWYTREVVAEVKPGNTGEAHLYLNKRFTEKPFIDNDSVKQVVMKSRLLSQFRKKDIFIKAAVVLPPGYNTNAQNNYPVVFIVPGWGGVHTDVLDRGPARRYGFGMGKAKIYVYLNPETQTPFGLHAFVDSRVNGPWGKALVEELTPYLQQHYRIDTDPAHHFVVGQSSGGYAALWLQLNYPKAFGGCWAVSPDPVDFENYTSVNLYAKNANMYYDEKGAVRPFFIMNGKALSTIKNFSQFESFLGDGGQMQSFEAEFGLPDKNGRPRILFNRETGAVDEAVAQTFKPYDMGLFIQNNYGRLAKDLKGKVHVFAGADDNFFLNGAVLLLKEKAEKVHADVTAELIPGANHWSIWSPQFTKRVQQEIDERVQ